MKYDFETIPARRGTGSIKWDSMLKLQPHLPEDVLPFSIADMEFVTAPEIREGLCRYLETGVLGYTAPTDAYYRSVSGWMKRRHGFSVSEDQIVLSDGVVPAIDAAVRIFTGSNDAVLVPTPVYFPFFSAVAKAGRKLATCDLIRSGDAYVFDFDSFEREASKPETTLCILSSPHNPIGKVYSAEALKRIAGICRENHVYLICDEIHHDLILPGHTFFSAGTLPDDLKQNIMLCTAPSKTFNLAGLACSNLVFFDSTKRDAFVNGGGSHNVNALGLAACRIAYDCAEPWLNALLRVLDGNRAAVEEYLHKYLPMLHPTRLEATYLMWIDCRELGMDDRELMIFLRSRALLHANAGNLFGTAGSGFIRINIACPREPLMLMLARLRAAVDYGRLTW